MSNKYPMLIVSMATLILMLLMLILMSMMEGFGRSCVLKDDGNDQASKKHKHKHSA